MDCSCLFTLGIQRICGFISDLSRFKWRVSEIQLKGFFETKSSLAMIGYDNGQTLLPVKPHIYVPGEESHWLLWPSRRHPRWRLSTQTGLPPPWTCRQGPRILNLIILLLRMAIQKRGCPFQGATKRRRIRAAVLYYSNRAHLRANSYHISSYHYIWGLQAKRQRVV